MKHIYSDILPFRGNHYDFGYYQGERLKESFILGNRERQWRIRRPRFSINVLEAKQAITRIAPQLWVELVGLQDALEWSMEHVLLEFGGYRLDDVKSGCSIFTQEDYMIRNYDYHPRTYEGRYVLFQPTDGGHATIGPSQRVTGRMDGMNEEGLVLGYNFIHRKKPEAGFICSMIGRLVLETCANVDEAVSLLEEMPHRHSFSYILLDSFGETCIVEASPRGVEVRQSNICTNHFEKMQHENRHHLADSYKRMHTIQSKQSNVTNAFEAYRMMNEERQGVFSKNYKSWAGTIHTAAYFPKERKAWFALGDDSHPAVFDFAAWLEGVEMTKERLYGEVETDLSFVHMEET